ncbi:hypothetical protein WELLINGTON_201 [Erwinia phage Wellington]|jgi:hypothetical protein|uniref:Uncharacterized protein n=2 Tax=Wellingtonvirus wellington TaxID=2734153 RepID=A0A1B2IEA3_9CAUD|nr:hypothetical protein BIZ80_gp097 [Erwinia phage vB_EamM_Kwan]YP_009806685.1 hypothetical protein HOT70_gp100 [Erwinia phage Wellington]ANZ49554.1 hypothetical protein KWAN_202 [Erwinia phage vB_EamM_Kwan]AXF51329.1 hypothetical protein WELLINGTON_201 [Erwinia phage Wellington]
MFRAILIVIGFIVAAANISVVRAAPSFDGVLIKPYKYQPAGFDKCSSNPLVANSCRETEKMEQFTILHQPGGETCPAGYFYLLDDKQQAASALPTEECDPSVVLNFVKNPTNNQVFIVMSLHGEPVSKFTIQ